MDSSEGISEVDSETTQPETEDTPDDTAVVIPGCATELLLNTTFDLDPGGVTTQIHASVAFDGEGVWIAYNLPEGNESGGFDVFAAKLNCDGTQALAPFTVNTTEGRNDVDPTIAVRDGHVFVVWHSDSGTGIDNMDIFYRTFLVDGTPVMAEDRILETSRGGESVTGNAMSPAAVALPDDRFVIAGSRGLEEAGTFQVFWQEVSLQGELVGEARDGYFEPGTSQMGATIAPMTDGFYIAWERSESNDDEHVVHTHFGSGSLTGDFDPPPRAVSALASAPSAVYDPINGVVYLAFHYEGTGRLDIGLTVGSNFDREGDLLTLGNSRIDHSPAVVAGDGGGALMWYRNVSGIRNRVIVQRFGYNGSTFEALGQVDLGTADAAPYGAAITYLGETVYFVAWSEGHSPELYLKGQFVLLE